MEINRWLIIPENDFHKSFISWGTLEFLTCQKYLVSYEGKLFCVGGALSYSYPWMGSSICYRPHVESHITVAALTHCLNRQLALNSPFSKRSVVKKLIQGPPRTYWTHTRHTQSVHSTCHDVQVCRNHANVQNSEQPCLHSIWYQYVMYRASCFYHFSTHKK